MKKIITISVLCLVTIQLATLLSVGAVQAWEWPKLPDPPKLPDLPKLPELPKLPDPPNYWMKLKMILLKHLDQLIS